MTANVTIPDALATYLNTIELSPAVTIAYPGAGFDATGKDRWIQAKVMPAEPQQVGRDNLNSVIHRGFVQVNCFVLNEDKGEEPALLLADAVIQHFKHGTEIQFDGLLIEVVAPGPTRFPSIDDSPWIMVPVRVPYICATKETTS